MEEWEVKITQLASETRGRFFKREVERFEGHLTGPGYGGTYLWGNSQESIKTQAAEEKNRIMLGRQRKASAETVKV